MRTSTFSHRNTSYYYIVGFLSILLTSCGSYQNSSYYDGDGIYGNTGKNITERENQNAQNNYYKQYFASLQNNNQPVDIFTDIDSYSNYNTDNDSIQHSNYGPWGSNSQKTTINIYPNQWDFSLGFGFGYPYYGWGYSNYGWNYPYYGWGYPYYGYYGWNYPYYGWGYSGYNYNNNYNNYSRNPSRRGSSYPNAAGINRNYNYGSSNYNNYSRNSINNTNGNSPTFTRNRFQNQNNYYNNPSRRADTRMNNSRNEGYTPTRSYTPNPRSQSNPTYRSYSPSSNNSNYGGDRSRPSGGGRRR